jgi:hypothetical protein
MSTATEKIMRAILGSDEWFAKSKERFLDYQAKKK